MAKELGVPKPIINKAPSADLCGLRQCYEAFNHSVSDKSARDFLKEWKMEKGIR